jgi:RimJ/RimL family protein N-acetyltransferase
VDLRHVATPRLQLDAVVPDDLDAHVSLMSDPGSWAHLPSGRHTDPAKTADGIRHSVGHWERDGLGYWTARLRTDLADPPAGLAPGSVVGTGGCAVRVGTSWWNLYYRLTPRAWGLGLAAEMVTASLDAAHSVDPDRPVIAYLVEHNVQSRGRAERSGLSLIWRGPDAGNPDPAAVRLVYADRPLDDDVLARVTALT